MSALRLGTAWGAVALLALAAWRLFPAEASGAVDRPALRVVLVDASSSVRARRGIDWIPWVRGRLAAEAEAARAAGEEFAVVGFADEVRRRFGPAPPAEFLDTLWGRDGDAFDPRVAAGSDGATRLAEALRVARRLATEVGRQSGRLVLLGDGGWSDQAPGPEVAAARRAGLGLEWTAPPAPVRADLACLAIEVPAELEVGAPLVARVTLRFAPGRRTPSGAALFVDVENTGGTFTSACEVELPTRRGASELIVPIDCGTVESGRTTMTARVVLGEGARPVLGAGPSAPAGRVADGLRSNDRARTSFVAGDDLVLGVLASDLERAREWLAPASGSGLVGVQYVFLDPADLSLVLPELDALVTVDLPLERLPEAPLEDWVRGGGGWLAIAGWNFLHDFSPGREGRLHGLLPLKSAPEEHGPREVVLLVDGSGSMEGEPFETVRAACLELVRASLATDRVALRFFTTVLEDEHLVKERQTAASEEDLSGARAAERLLLARVPGGTTHILTSLEAFGRLRARSSDQGLALLLTDGREQDAVGDPSERARALRASLAASRTRLVVIGVGESLDRTFLRLFAPAGEEPLEAHGLGDLERIFRREISGSSWRAGRLPVDFASPVAGSLAADVFRIPSPGGLPLLERVLRTVPAGGAEVPWTTGDDAVLGLQRVGAGRTALFASAPLEGWGAAWAGMPGLGEPRLFASLLRWLGRGTRRERALGEPTVSATDGWLRLGNLPDATPLDLVARVVDADPGRTGRRDGVELGRLRFGLAAGAGLEPSERVARPTGALARALIDPGHWLEVELDGSLRRLPAPLLEDPELDPGGPRLAPGSFRADPAPAGRARGRGDDPRAAELLVAGLLALFAAGLLLRRAAAPPRSLRGQGIPGDGR